MAATALFHAIVHAPGPIGPVHVVSNGVALVGLDFGAPELRLAPFLQARFGAAVALVRAEDPQGFASCVKAYLAGDIAALDGLPVDGGGTAFQRRVWDMLRAIPPGQTRTYGDLARALGQPGAARAVGLANGRNPVSLAVPCHRVIGGGGGLTGYGGGLARKQWLLAHERAAHEPMLPLAVGP